MRRSACCEVHGGYAAPAPADAPRYVSSAPRAVIYAACRRYA